MIVRQGSYYAEIKRDDPGFSYEVKKEGNPEVLSVGYAATRETIVSAAEAAVEGVIKKQRIDKSATA